MTDSDSTAPAPRRAALSHYDSVSAPADTWLSLKHLTAALNETRPARRRRPLRPLSRALGTLEPIETYWAFPGKDAFQQLRRLFEL